MNILITGGTGFVGTAFRTALAKRGHSFVSFDLHPPDQPAGEYIRGDVRDPPALTAAMKNVDAVIHLAAAHHDFGISRETFEAVNIEGTQNVCTAMCECGVKKLVFYSTVALYGSKAGIATESSAPAPESDYGRTKLGAEAECRKWSESNQQNHCLILRPTVIFGPGNFANMYSLIRQVESGKFLRVGAMENIKSLAYVDNIVAATLSLWLDKPEKLDGFEIFNYVDQPDLTSRQIVEAIYSGLGRKPPAFFVPYLIARLLVVPFDLIIKLTGKNLPVSSARIRKLAKANTQFDASRIHDLIEIETRSVQSGIREMVEWYLEAGKQATAPNRRPPPEIVKK